MPSQIISMNVSTVNWLQNNSRGFGYPEYFPAMAAVAWIVRLRKARESIGSLRLGPKRILEVRYETLISDPATTISRIESFLDIPHDDRVLAVARRQLVLGRGEIPEFSLPAPVFREFVREQKELGYSIDGVKELSRGVCSRSAFVQS